MSKPRPTCWQKMHWNDFFADTPELDGFQSGIYLILIGRYWVKGRPLADDDAIMARIARISLDQWLSVRPALEPFFVIANGEWRHKRIEHDLVEAHQAHEAAVKRGRDAIAKRWGSAQPKPQPVDTSTIAVTAIETLYQSEAEAESEPKKKKDTPPPSAAAGDSFDKFWALWPKKVKRKGSREAFLRALKKVGGDPSVILRAAKVYSEPFANGSKSTDFQAAAEVWLNGERWTDSSLLKLETPELPRQTTIAEDIAAAGALIEENPVSFIPSWFKGS